MTENKDGGGQGLRSLLHRLLIVYTFLYMLPFPLDMLMTLHVIPWVRDTFLGEALGAVVGLHGQVTGPIVKFLGMHLLGQEVSLEMTGSGDGLASYLDVLLDLTLAVLLAAAWWLWRRSTAVSPIISDVNRVFLRYFLFINMIGYGLAKVIPGGQFPALGPDRLIQTYGESSPMGVLWSFMGASLGYQFFTGAMEIIGGILLLFRRTTLLGALLVAGVMGHVFMLNMFYDVPVKLFSFHLLLLAMILVLPDARRLFAFFVTNKAVPPGEQQAPWVASPRLKRTFVALKVLFVTMFLLQYVESGRSWYARGTEALTHPLRGIYQVESFTVAEGEQGQGKEIKPWLRVGLTPTHSITILHSDGLTERLKLKLDMEASKLKIYDRDSPEPEGWLQFETEGDLLGIEGEFKQRQIVVKLRREDRESLLYSRGFRWITEEPFNR